MNTSKMCKILFYCNIIIILFVFHSATRKQIIDNNNLLASKMEVCICMYVHIHTCVCTYVQVCMFVHIYSCY